MSKTVLTIDGLSVGFGRSKQVEQVTDGVSLAIRKGETLALVGESGSGKSVTANSILKLLPKGSANIICYDIIKNNMVNDEYISSWINGLARVLDIEDYITSYKARINVKNLIRSIYFRLLTNSNNNVILFTLADLEKKLNKYLID